MSIVRILRILEYEGPRDWVEKSLNNRGVKGGQRVGNFAIIREAIVGNFFTLVKGEKEESYFEYFCSECGQFRLSFDLSLGACGNCGSKRIITGYLGSLDKEKLKREFEKKKGGESK